MIQILIIWLFRFIGNYRTFVQNAIPITASKNANNSEQMARHRHHDEQRENRVLAVRNSDP